MIEVLGPIKQCCGEVCICDFRKTFLKGRRGHFEITFLSSVYVRKYRSPLQKFGEEWN